MIGKTMTRRGLAALATAGAVVAAVAGCGGGPSVESSKTEATVKGTIKVRGEPAKEGEVIFDPSNVARRDAAPRRAPIGPDGTYTITTLIGENVVSLDGPPARKVPLADSQLILNVERGENTMDLAFPRP